VIRRTSVLLAMSAAALLCPAMPAAAASLQAAFAAAGPQDGYDRWVELETGVVYTGGLLIGAIWDDDRGEFVPAGDAGAQGEVGCDVRIVGNGAILDLQGQHLCISFCDRRLDITDCIITGGEVRFRGDLAPAADRAPQGSVRHCTFWRPQDHAVRLQGAGAGIILERNLVVDPVDTGLDYMIWSGAAGPNLPTGLAFGLSVQTGTYGTPEVRENWTWFSDPVRNAIPLHHFCFL